MIKLKRRPSHPGKILKEDFKFEQPENLPLKKYLLELHKHKADWSKIS